MHRREFLTGALASPLWLAWQAAAQSPIFTGDMHFHSFFAESKYHSRPLAQTLAAGNTTLAAWSLVGDVLWFDVKTYKQKSVPKPGEALGWFQRELGRIKEHVASQNSRSCAHQPDVDRALRGEPHIVLAVEGASFIEADARRVKTAYDFGLRHLQLVHYTRNAIGDIQTEPPDHPGLTQSANRLSGMQSSWYSPRSRALHGARRYRRLSISRAPVVWSHGSVTRGP